MMFRPVKYKCIKTSTVLGGGEENPTPLETIGKAEPTTSVVQKFRPSDGSKVEFYCPNTETLWRFLAENTYEDILREPKGNRYGLTGVTCEQFGGEWVIMATAWPMEPLYVSAPSVTYKSERVVTGFEQDISKAGSQDSLPKPPEANGAWTLVGTMGNRGIGSGAHWHIDEFSSRDTVAWGAQIPPRGAPGKPVDVPFRVGRSPTYEEATTYQFGQSPDHRETSGYGFQKRRGRVHSGVDCVSPTNRYLFARAGSFIALSGIGGYGTYVVSGRFGVGHMDLAVTPNQIGGSIPKPPLASGFSQDAIGLNSLALIPPPMDGQNYGRFTLPRDGSIGSGAAFGLG